ncbi:MAG: hypothetical protein ABEJ34_06705 [Haloferacaceae archaeon]
MPRFDYPCPDCRTANSLHDAECRFEGVEWARIEDAYFDVVASLATGVRPEDDLLARWEAELGDGRDDGVDPDATAAVAPPDRDDGVDPVALRRAALARLKREGRVSEENGSLRLLPAEEFREEVAEPTHEPMRTLYRHGSVPGCHDNAVFAMIAWYEMVGLSWPETRERVVEWLVESGAWDRGGFEEATPAELVDKKRHVYESGYGWKEKAGAAKRVIDRWRS